MENIASFIGETASKIFSKTPPEKSKDKESDEISPPLPDKEPEDKSMKIQQVDSSGVIDTWIFNEPGNSGELPSIHPDDSIRVMKNKILKQMKQVSYKELYMFSETNRPFDPVDIYKEVTSDGETLDYPKITQLCKNLHVDSLPDEKTMYMLDDFKILFKEGEQERLFDYPIGQRFEKQHNYLFTANPFEIVNVTLNGKKTPLFSFENSLVLNWLDTNDQVFLCTAEQVLEYAEKKEISQEYMIQMYFPFLYKDGIRSLEDLMKNRQKLMDEYRKSISDETWKLYDTVDMFYHIRENATSKLPYLSVGITSFKMILHTDFSNILPLDTIFKFIHSTSEIPFIKFNPGFRRENMYRLFSDHTATNGKKIPKLSTMEISKLSKETGRTGQITLLIQENYNTQPINVFLNFNKDGKMYLRTEMKKPIQQEEVIPLVEKMINPILEQLNAFLFETGYKIRIPTPEQMKSFQDPFMEIEQIQYVASMKISKKMDLKKYKGCLSSIFDIEDTDIHSEKGARMKLKRVENYQDMDPISLSISNNYSKTREIEDVITELMSEFKLTEEQARERIVKFFGEHTVIQGRLLDNAGFPITIKVTPSDNIMKIQIDQIQSLTYIHILFCYLDSMIRIFQEPESSSSIKTFMNMCKKSVNYKNVDKSTIATVVAAETAMISNMAQPILFESDDSDFFREPGIDATQNEDKGEEIDDVGSQDTSKKSSQRNQDTDEEDDDDSMFGMDMEGGAGNDEDDDEETLEMNVEGKSLKNPNPFQEKIEKHDPVLILKKERGQYNPYSKSCPPAVMRQPVLLTSDEKTRIDSQHPDSYSSAILYGSDPNPENQHWYICPRYWSLKDNVSLTPEEVNEILKTNPNAIIPSKAKVVPKGAFIYEFNAPKEHLDEKGNYITHYPGLMKGKHPDGFSLPCCFKRVQNTEKEIQSDNLTQKINMYVMSANSRPLSENRFGFLPDQIQRFLKTDNNKCVEKTNAALMKQNITCILRYGVEQSDYQSFIGCVADIYSFLQNSKKKPTLKEMRKILSESITLDMFLQYHNGSLVSIFRPSTIMENIDLKKYADSWLVKEIQASGNEDEMLFLNETISSFETFLQYIMDESAYIDHTYMWDIITQPNSKIIPNGLNMVILTIPKPNQVEILCPTSAYSPKLFDPTKGTWILVKDGDFYEPIYAYENKKKIVVHRLFEGGSKALDKKMENMLHFLENTMKTQCSPKNSLPNLYNFKRNMSAHEMYKTITSNNYVVHLQVMNYDSKIIGLVVEQKTKDTSGNKFYVPCAPSTLIDEVDLILIDQVKDWKDYKTTIKELNQLYVKTQGKIKCSPKIKMIDDGKIIGILTETDQYVKIYPAMENVGDQLEEIEGMDYIEADKVIIGNVAPNNKRVRTIRNIQMESRFYRIFRAMVRDLLSHYETRFYKLQIQDMLENMTYSYSQKMDKIEGIVRKVVGDSIVFKSMTEDTIDYLAEDDHFMDYVRCKKCETRNICKMSADGHCHLHLPSRNLVMGMSNDELYYTRLSDELLRFHRVRSFMLEPMYYLNLSNIDYKINDNEILLLETFLKSEHFSDLRLFNFSDYLRQIPYDIADPQTK